MAKKSLTLIITVAIASFMAFAFTGCGGGSEFEEYVKPVAGEYQAVAVDAPEDPDDYIGGYWHLSIRNDEEAGGWYLSIYDNEAGNPGVEGLIGNMDESSITVNIDPDYYDQLPSAVWDCNGEVLEVGYTVEGDSVILTNSGNPITFTKCSDEE